MCREETRNATVRVLVPNIPLLTHIASSGHKCLFPQSEYSMPSNIEMHSCPPAATDCSGTFSEDEPTNHFTAVCSSSTAHGSTCELTVSVGYAGGSVTCDTADGQYDVVPATGASSHFYVYALCIPPSPLPPIPLPSPLPSPPAFSPFSSSSLQLPCPSSLLPRPSAPIPFPATSPSPLTFLRLHSV